MAEITAARLNNLQSRIELILGNGSGETGYGQTTESSQVLPGDLIDADNLNNLYTDIIKARIHQVGPSDPSVTEIQIVLENQNVVADETSFIINDSGVVIEDPEGTKKGIADFEDLVRKVETDKNNVHPSQASSQTAVTSTRTSTWNGLIYHEFTVTFGSNDSRRHFFNTGGEIRIDPSNDNASTPKGLDWAALTNEVGIVRFNSRLTTASSGSGTSIGNYQLTSTYQTIYFKEGNGTYSGVYAGNIFQIKAREVSDTQISFRVEFNDVVVDNNIDNNVDGTLRSLVTLYRATGNVSVPTPGVFTNVDLVGNTPGSSATYVLTPSLSAANEGSPFTVTLSTFNVPSGTTVPFTISGVSADDLVSGSLTGNFVLDGNGVGIKTFAVVADEATEGVETFELALDNNLARTSVLINDSSAAADAATYLLSTSSTSVNEGGTVSFILTTTNVSNGTQVPFTITGISREDLSDGTYSWDDWYNEFNTSYLAGISKDDALEGKDFVYPYYNGNDQYVTTSFGTRYGLFRLPDAAGIAYWVREWIGQNKNQAAWENIFWSSVEYSTVPIAWAQANGTETDSSRSKTPNKTYLIGTGSGSGTTYTWDDWYDEYKNTYFGGATKEQVLAEKDFVLPLYESNDVYNTSLGTRYGLFRKPKAAGIAYWVNDLTAGGISRADTINNFFYAASFESTVVQYGGLTDSQRVLTQDKAFIGGGNGVVQDRGEYGTVGDRGTPGGTLSDELQDAFTVYGNTAFKNYNPVADLLTEGEEVMTLTLDNGSGVSASITINDTSLGTDEPPNPIPVPTINSFTFNRSPAYWGEPVFANWDVTNATSITVTIAGLGASEINTYTTLTGSSNILIFEEADGTGNVTATLTATNAGGGITATATIPVLAPEPTISAFYSEPLGPVEIGVPVRWVYQVSNASSATIETNYDVDYTDIALPNGSTGATSFTAEQIGTKTATLTATNLSGQTVSQSRSFEVVNEVEPTPPSWLIQPEWSGLAESVAFGTTGRGFLQADGDIDSVEYTITGPSGTATDIVDYTPGSFYYTPNYGFTAQGSHTVTITVSGPGGSISGSDTVVVLPPA